jgi:uncharacterized membrane protein YkoI
MKQKLLTGALLIATLSMSAVAMTMSLPGKSREGSQKSQAKLAKQAKITLAQARKIAVKRAPGTIEEGELEREHGKLVYSFDIRNGRGTITEVQVDARNGRVVSVEEENAKQEADEKREDQRKANANKHP